MGRNYFNQFKRGLNQTFTPMTVFSKDPIGVTDAFLHPTNNMPQSNPVFGGANQSNIFGLPPFPKLPPIGDVICTGLGFCPGKDGESGGGTIPPPPSPDSGKETALLSVEDMAGTLSDTINHVLDIIGFDKMATAIGMNPVELRDLLNNPDRAGDRFKALGDLAGVVAGIVNVFAVTTGDAPLALIAQQIGMTGTAIRAGGDLIEIVGETGVHFHNGDYGKMTESLKKMNKLLKGVVSDEVADKLQLDKLDDRLDTANNNIQLAKDARDAINNVLSKVKSQEFQDALDIKELEEDQDKDAAQFIAQQQQINELQNQLLLPRDKRGRNRNQQPIDRNKFPQLPDDRRGKDAEPFPERPETNLQKLDRVLEGEQGLARGQQGLRRGQELLAERQNQIEGQNRRILAEEGIIEKGQSQIRQAQRRQIQSSRTNNEILKQIGRDNRGQTQAIKHSQVILDNELQKLDTDERDEIDATLRMAVKLDPPRNLLDFVKDLNSFETNPHRVQYIAENYQQFIRLPQEQIDQLLSKMIQQGAIASF